MKKKKKKKTTKPRGGGFPPFPPPEVKMEMDSVSHDGLHGRFRFTAIWGGFLFFLKKKEWLI